MSGWEYHVEFADPETYSQDQTTNRKVTERLTAQGAEGPHRKKSAVWLVVRLNELGKRGWELVEMRPYKVGGNHDVIVAAHGSGGLIWSDHYLLIFKRPLRGDTGSME